MSLTKDMKFDARMFIIISSLFLVFSFYNVVKADTNSDVHINYQSHVENVGWQGLVSDGATTGTVGESLRLEALKIAVPGMSVSYQAHVQHVGWMDWVQDGQMSGTTGQSLRLEAIRIKLNNAPAGYHVQYQVHVQNIGWMDWVQDGQVAGTTGEFLRLEAIRIKVVKDQQVSETQNLQPRVCIDAPSDNAVVQAGTNEIPVTGWSLNSSGVKGVQIIVDGAYKGNANMGVSRPDVNRVYPGYPGGETSGYIYNLNTSELAAGQHTLTVRSIGNDGNRTDESKTITINKPAAKTIAVAIDIGHNAPYDSGATGIKQEDTITMEVGQRVIDKLKAAGYNVISTKPDTASSTLDSLQQRVDAANNGNAQLFVSIHANAGGGSGTEVWAGGSAKSIELAHNIENNMVALGYANRGVKVQGVDGQHLYVLNNTVMPAVLVETCFVDSTGDINRYNPDNIATAIVKGIISSAN